MNIKTSLRWIYNSWIGDYQWCSEEIGKSWRYKEFDKRFAVANLANGVDFVLDMWFTPRNTGWNLKGTKVDNSISDYLSPRGLGGHIWHFQQSWGGPRSWHHCRIQQDKVWGVCTILVHVVPTNWCFLNWSGVFLRGKNMVTSPNFGFQHA
jgi:hypothetical protein